MKGFKPISTRTLEKLIWVLIYGGLGILSLGLFVQRQDLVMGLVIILVGSTAAFVGAVLIIVRSRMRDPGDD